MKIPIDRYRLLGVSTGADNHIILNQLERKLEKGDYLGFSNETQEKRNEILKDNTSLLLNEERRKAYENAYVSTVTFGEESEPTVEIKQDYEIAGLLLLLESGEVEECLKMAEQVFRQRRFNMNYFGTDFKDLNKVIDYATLGYADKLKSKRHYETAAEVLDRRIKSQSVGMGEKEIISVMATELKQLLPFRVLDMLSRTNDEEKHATGINLLEKLVTERGGLDNSCEIYMSNEEFHAFFRQIRSYLTVQEQISLYQRWASEGSKAGKFLYCIALVAQGFSQRKPNRIHDAVDIMKSSGSNELQPIVANMYLLLGDIENAKKIFEEYADEPLKAWSKEKAEEPLARLCEWCREWLERDVLRGYKDIEVEADIDSYFSDKDVMSYIEKIDREGVGSMGKTLDHSQDRLVINKEDFWSNNTNAGDFMPKCNKDWKGRSWVGETKQRIKTYSLLRENFLVFLVIAISSCSLLLFTRVSTKGIPEREQKRSIVVNNEGKHIDRSLSRMELARESISKWLYLKKKVLSENKTPMNAELVATTRLLNQLETERKMNQKKGTKQYIDATIKKIEIKEDEPKRLRVLAELKYRDKLISADGNIVEQTEEHTFQRYYQLIWQDGRWVVDK